MQAVGPEHQPGFQHRRVNLRNIKIAVDNGADLRLRRIRRLPPLPLHHQVEVGEDLAHTGVQQAVFIAEIVADDAGGHARLFGDYREARFRQPYPIDYRQGGFN